LAAFTVGSLLSGIAGSGIELVIFRALQGIGGAMVFSTSLALLVQTFKGRGLGMALGVWSAVINLGLGCGPVLGGLLTETSWRWIFFVNIPLGVVAVLMTLVGVQEVRLPDGPRIDVPGGGVFTVGLVGLIYGLIDSGNSGWNSAEVIAALAVATVALVRFPLVERARRQPMFDLFLLRKPTFAGGLAAALGMNGSLYAVLLYLVLYLQNGLRTSALDTGLELLVIMVTAMATAVLAGRLQQNVPVRLMIGLGLGLIGLGLLLMRGLSGESDWKHLIVGMAIAGAGSGFVNTPLASTAVGVVRPERAGMASGINATFGQVSRAPPWRCSARFSTPGSAAPGRRRQANMPVHWTRCCSSPPASPSPPARWPSSLSGAKTSSSLRPRRRSRSPQRPATTEPKVRLSSRARSRTGQVRDGSS